MKISHETKVALADKTGVTEAEMHDILVELGFDLAPPRPTKPGFLFNAYRIGEGPGDTRLRFVVSDLGNLVCYEGVSDGLRKVFSPEQFEKLFQVAS